MINIMEVCGTHTYSIAKHGIKAIFKNVKFISGPGCPVCVTSQSDIDKAIWLASTRDIILCTFGDMLKVPGSDGNSLEKVRAEGKDVRVVFSPMDCLKICRKESKKEVVFLGIGFETTSPTVAATIIRAKELGIENFYVLSFHKLIPPVIRKLLEDEDVLIDGFLLPGHVSVIIGKTPYEFIAENYKKACVIAGFEAEDIVRAVKMIISQIERKEPAVEIQYRRAVKDEGNPKAVEMINRVFVKSAAEWRGIGVIEDSGLKISSKFQEFDAEKVFDFPDFKSSLISKDCLCGEIITGKKEPKDCPLFMCHCTPFTPYGPCMVSQEGTCFVWYNFLK